MTSSADLERLWPDPDRRADASMRTLIRIAAQPDPRTTVTRAELRALQAASFGLDEQGVAQVLGWQPFTVKTTLKHARRALRAKNTTHACCEALRQGLIR